MESWNLTNPLNIYLTYDIVQTSYLEQAFCLIKEHYINVYMHVCYKCNLRADAYSVPRGVTKGQYNNLLGSSYSFKMYAVIIVSFKQSTVSVQSCMSTIQRKLK